LREEIEIMTTKSKKAAKKTKAPKPRTARAALAVAKSSKSSLKERVDALIEAPLAACESDENLQSMLQMLRDPKQPIKVRLAVLQSLQAASFSVITFEPCRADYLATLREVVDDSNEELRERALGILAREKDGYAQKRLLEGLESKDKALVSPERRCNFSVMTCTLRPIRSRAGSSKSHLATTLNEKR
jgi:hypothetical protein